jgi:putative aminopeptidase FrvX
MLEKESESRLIKLCQDLVKVKSLSGEEEEVAQVLATFFKESGFDEIKIDSCGNSIGLINGNMPGPTIVINGL